MTFLPIDDDVKFAISCSTSSQEQAFILCRSLRRRSSSSPDTTCFRSSSFFATVAYLLRFLLSLCILVLSSGRSFLKRDTRFLLTSPPANNIFALNSRLLVFLRHRSVRKLSQRWCFVAYTLHLWKRRCTECISIVLCIVIRQRARGFDLLFWRAT